MYDGGCGICLRFQRIVSTLDRKKQLEWINLHDADYDSMPVDKEDCVEAMQAIDDGSVYAGYNAVRRICKTLPVLWPAYVFLSLPDISHAGHHVYRSVASHRHCNIADHA